MSNRPTHRRQIARRRPASRYPTLLFVAKLFVLTASIYIALAVFAFFAGTFIFLFHKNPLGIAILVAAPIIFGWAAAVLFASAELLRLLVDIANDTRETTRLLDDRLLS